MARGWEFWIYKVKKKCTFPVAKTKALISFAVFVFAYKDWWFFSGHGSFVQLLSELFLGSDFIITIS